MSWRDVGDWIKANAGDGAALVGSLLTGNVAGAVAKGVSLVASATGTDDPGKALAAFQNDPETTVRLRELAVQEQASIRQHIEAMERIKLESHAQTQQTIRAGDAALDGYVRQTRPQMARQSWKATVAYCFACLLYQAFSGESIFNAMIAGILSAPAWAYLGLRTSDKFAAAWEGRKNPKQGNDRV